MANIPDSAVESLLGNLKELIEYKPDLIRGVRENVQVILKDLEMLKAFIKHSTKKQNNSAVLENVMSEIKSVAYEAEDAIETYIVSVSSRQRGISLMRPFYTRSASELQRVEKKIAKVTKYVQDIYKNMVPLGIETMQSVEISGTAPHRGKIMVEEFNVIGLEDASKEMIELLTNGPERKQVISIVGMFGLGKTTLARKISNDPSIKKHFHLRAFVNISQKYNQRGVLLGILNSFGHVTKDWTNMSERDNEDPTVLVDKYLKGNRYLIVLDDVCAEVWDDLKLAFPDDCMGSRVVITSQNRSVALQAQADIRTYYMRFLYPDESRMLLRQKVFGQSELPQELEKHEVHILQMCGGLPLAIVLLAGILLNDRHSVHWWKKVSEGLTEFIASDVTQMIDVIKLSYNNLPRHLKPCFLYLGVFPEDCDIHAWKLLQLWIAEGFIESHQHMSLEDVAHDYLMELVNKNLVMVGSRSWDGHIKTCRIHDILRDFCKMEARKENLFHEIKGNSQSESSSLDTYRRICVNDSVLDFIGSKPSGMHGRSLLCFSKNKIPLPIGYVLSILKAFKLLRILEIRSLILNRLPLPAKLFELILLKYIAICCDFSILPQKLLDLWNLQTLIIETSSPTLYIRADISKMAHLRHLHTNASASLQMSKDKPLSNSDLQTLSTISPESCTKEVFDRVPKLKKLGVRGNLVDLFDARGESSLFDNLSGLQELENLKLLNSDQTFKLQHLPSPDKFPRKLRKLTLLNTSLDWVHMSTLGKLKMLEVLKLKDNAFQGERWQTEDGDFPSLRALHIGHTDLKVLEASADHFPNLRSLSFRQCAQLESLPPGLADKTTLEEINLEYTSSKLVTSARKIHRDLLDMGSECNLFVYPPE